MRYYDLGNGFHVCYSTTTFFECENSEEHPMKGLYRRGEIIRETISDTIKQIDENIAEITIIFRNTKLYKGVDVNCPHCDGKIICLGWKVYVEDHRNQKIVMNIISMGTKYPYSKYCKTLKTRKATIDRLRKKYSQMGRK